MNSPPPLPLVKKEDDTKYQVQHEEPKEPEEPEEPEESEEHVEFVQHEEHEEHEEEEEEEEEENDNEEPTPFEKVNLAFTTKKLAGYKVHPSSFSSGCRVILKNNNDCGGKGFKPEQGGVCSTHWKMVCL